MRQLTGTEREELTRWSRSLTLAARDVFVASLILALADGKSYTQIERELTSVADLSRKLMKYIRLYGKLAKPFRWTYTDASRRIK